MTRKIKVCHLSSVHPPFDVRIFHKEVKTLAKAGYQVTLIVQHDHEEIVDDVRIVPLPKPKSRFERFIKTSWLLLKLALREKADVYHFHDPELMPTGLVLKCFGKKVIYDVHEDYGQKILSKLWIPFLLRRPTSWFFDVYENIASLFFDYIITADSHTNSKFMNRNKGVIANFPPLTPPPPHDKKDSDNIFKLIYVGGISEDRGIRETIKALEYLNAENDQYEFHLLGPVSNPKLEKDIRETKNVVYHGRVPWEQVLQHLLIADIGIVLLQPVPAYLYCPGENILKLFEYMSVKLPIIISNFPKLESLITEVGCGVSVDPTNPEKISAQIKFLRDHPEVRKKMGNKGRQAFEGKFNWELESSKLIEIYQKVLTLNDKPYI